jgi:hypothetical protein
MTSELTWYQIKAPDGVRGVKREVVYSQKFHQIRRARLSYVSCQHTGDTRSVQRWTIGYLVGQSKCANRRHH